VSIPWNNLSTNPTEVHIDGLYLLIVPKNGTYQIGISSFVFFSNRNESRFEQTLCRQIQTSSTETR
jgi:hypothetical protein